MGKINILREKTRQKIKNITSDKKKLAITIIIIAVLLAGFGVLTKHMYSNYYHIQIENAAQNKLNLDVNWKKNKSEAYIVTVYKNGKKVEKIKTHDLEASIPLKEVEVEYTVKVRSSTLFGGLFKSKKKVKTHKLSQVIAANAGTAQGFAGDDIKIKCSAKTNLTYVSADKNIAQIYKNGSVKLKEPGEVKVIIKAEETDFYKPAEMTIKVISYPSKLEEPSMEIKDKDSLASTLTWTEVPYAQEYEIAAYNPWNQKYEIVKTVKAEDGKKVDVLKTDTAYKIRAKANILERDITSDWSKDAKVQSDAHKAETYKSLHMLGTIDFDQVETVAKIEGVKGTTCPQSFSFTGTGYVIAYARSSGKDSVFVEYDLNGNYVRSKTANMGHGNGSAYNPNTNKIYTLKQHMKIKSNVCTMFDYETLEEAGKVTLPYQASGISYDATNGKYYLSGGGRIDVLDSEFKTERTIQRLIIRAHTQDVGAGNGVALACSWNSGSDSYVDIYRASDGGYLGTYKVPLGEIESATMVDKHLVLLINNAKGTSQDMIYRTKDQIPVI